MLIALAATDDDRDNINITVIENAAFNPQRHRSSSFNSNNNESFKEMFNDEEEDVEIINVSPSSHENDKNDQVFDEDRFDEGSSRPCARLGDIVGASLVDSPPLGQQQTDSLHDTRKSIENTTSSDESSDWPNEKNNSERGGDEFEDSRDGQEEANEAAGEESKDTTQVC